MDSAYPQQDKQHIKLSYITHFYFNQKDIATVTHLLREYEKLPADLLDVIEFVIVDDCSPIEYEIPTFNLNITWLRITTDIAWNQAGARNLGATYAKSDKIVLVDVDQSFPEDTLRYMVNRKNPGRKFFRVYRVDDDGKRFRGHPNMFFMSRARFMRFFGYDEEFSGHYGAEDVRFSRIQKYHGSSQRYLPKRYLSYDRKLNRDDSYHSLRRDLSHNTPIDARKVREINTYGPEAGHSRIFLNFEWQIKSRQFRAVPARPTRRCWKLLWWFRVAFPFLAH